MNAKKHLIPAALALALLPGALRAACPAAVPAWTGVIVQTWEAESGTITAPIQTSNGGTAVKMSSGSHGGDASGTCAANGCDDFSFTPAISDEYKVEALVEFSD